MSNDKKPKKAKAPIIHGARHGGAELSGRLTEPVKVNPLSPAKKKR